jgi:hypothetical protein
MAADWIIVVMVRQFDAHLHPFHGTIRHQTLLQWRDEDGPRCSAALSWRPRQHDAGDGEQVRQRDRLKYGDASPAVRALLMESQRGCARNVVADKEQLRSIEPARV